MEVTIAMLVSAILIGITYTAYSIINKSYISFSRKNEDMAVVVRLDELLKKDFARAEIILKDNDGISLNSAGHIVKYQFDPDFTIRTDIRTDTFKVKTTAINTSFENSAVTEQATSEEQNRLDDLQLILLFQDEKIPYHYHKEYSSLNLIQRNPNAVN
jgi:hypothetical protein